MKKIMFVIIVALYAVSSSAFAKTATFGAVVTHVTDGDTVWVKTASGEAFDIRIQGIDAPERCQDYGGIAKQALTKLALHKPVTVTSKARDKYGRVIAKLKIGQRDVGAWMVLHGHAWSNHYRQSLGAYGHQEMAARQAGRGLWSSGSAIEPKVFRKHTKCYK